MPSYLQERHAVIQSFMPLPKRKAPLFRILGGQLPPCPPLLPPLEEKDLGIVVDDHLKFHQQTAAAAAKISQMLAVVKLSFANLDETTLPLLYKSMVRPFLQYGNAIWGVFEKLDQKR